MSSFFNLLKNKGSFLVKRSFILLAVVMLSFLTVINPISVKTTQSKFCSVASAAQFPNIKNALKLLFNKKNQKPILNEKIKVYLGGYPLGFTFKCDGVLVVADRKSVV